MTQPKIGSIGPILKKIYLAIKGYKRVFSRVEKIIITVLIFSAVTSLVFWVKEVRSQGDNYGVIYSEGWLSSNQAPSNQLKRLTYAGLTRYMKDGTIGADIAEKWEESEDHLTYTFHLRQNFVASAVLQNIEQNKELFGDASVSAEKDNTIVFKLKQPLNVFLFTTTSPIFPYGPYAVESQTEKVINLVARRDYHLEKPSIKKIIIRLYASKNDLEKALTAGKVLATADLDYGVNGFNHQIVNLPRAVSLFMNTRNEVLKEKETRKKIIDGENVSDMNLRLKLVTTTAYEVASELPGVVGQLEKQGIKVDVIELDTGTLVGHALPKRDFDLLLFGVDYGYGEDLYPFWHSSRAESPGNNFTGLKNKELDWKLEEARTTANLEERATKTQEAKEIIKSEYVELPIKSKSILYQSAPKVTGNELKKLADPLDRFNYISEWKISK